MAIVMWRWEEKDPRTGRWRVLRWMMDEVQAAERARMHQVELRKVPGSREERRDLYGGGYGQHVPPAPDKEGGVT